MNPLHGHPRHTMPSDVVIWLDDADDDVSMVVLSVVGAESLTGGDAWYPGFSFDHLNEGDGLCDCGAGPSACDGCDGSHV